MVWQQSRIDWLKEGDRNTSFFQARATARKNTNRIQYLIREDGTECSKQDELQGMVHDFYMKLFTSESCEDIDRILEAVPQKLTKI